MGDNFNSQEDVETENTTTGGETCETSASFQTYWEQVLVSMNTIPALAVSCKLLEGTEVEESP